MASRSEPRLAPFAGEPFFGLCLGMEANNVLLLPAKGVCRYETPRYPYPDRLRVKGDRIFCNIRHTDNYEPLWSLSLAALAPTFIRSARRRATTSRRHRRSRQASSRLFRNGQLCAWPFTSKNSLLPSDFCGQQTVKRAETKHSTSASGVQSCAQGECSLRKLAPRLPQRPRRSQPPAPGFALSW